MANTFSWTQVESNYNSMARETRQTEILALTQSETLEARVYESCSSSQYSKFEMKLVSPQ